MWSLNIGESSCGEGDGGRSRGRVGWDGDRGTVGVHLKVLSGERPSQISVGKIGSAQIPSRLFLFWRASNLAWVSGHFAAGAKPGTDVSRLSRSRSSILSQFFIIET
jgi:hypothetical protein